jgi:hypothetical protein
VARLALQVRRDQERLVDREDADGNHHDIDAVGKLRQPQREPLLPARVDADHADQQTDEQRRPRLPPAPRPEFDGLTHHVVGCHLEFSEGNPELEGLTHQIRRRARGGWRLRGRRGGPGGGR